MSTPSDDAGVRHVPSEQRFVLEVDGHEAELAYQASGDVLVITHTGVPQAIGGRGVAARLVEATVAHARAASLKVRPACSYAAAWFAKHPEARDLLDA